MSVALDLTLIVAVLDYVSFASFNTKVEELQPPRDDVLIALYGVGAANLYKVHDAFLVRLGSPC